MAILAGASLDFGVIPIQSIGRSGVDRPGAIDFFHPIPIDLRPESEHRVVAIERAPELVEGLPGQLGAEGLRFRHGSSFEVVVIDRIFRSGPGFHLEKTPDLFHVPKSAVISPGPGINAMDP